MATRIRDIALPLTDPAAIDAIVSQLPVGVIVAEAPGGRVVTVNARAEQLWRGEVPRAASIEEYGLVYTGYRPSGGQYSSDEWPLARAIQHGEVVADEEIEMLFESGERRIMLVSATPIFDIEGRVARAVTLFHDVTEQRQEERRREFLMELSDELRLLDEAIPIMETAAVATGEHLGVSSTSFADVDPDGRHAIVHAEYRNGRIVSTGKYYLEDFGPQLVERLRRGESVSVEDIASARDATPDIFEGWGIRSLLAVPAVRHGQLVGLFAVLHTAPRRWSRSDIALVGTVMERTWHAVESARVHAELRQSREWLTLALRAGSAATWEWDLRSGEIFWSEDEGRLLGLDTPRRSLTFGRWLALVHTDDRREAKKAAQHIATMREGDVEFEYRVAGSAEPRWINMRGRVIADVRGLPYRVVGVAVDTTDRKRTELEREDLLREAREASDAKSHFISVISHEFRTPLTAIIGYTDLLSTGVSGPLQPTQTRQLDRIRTSAWHLTQLVDEILTYSRLEAGRESLHFEAADVVTLARDAVSLVSPGAAAKGLGLACELPDNAIPVRTDAGKLRQVLLNLLGNAVKFTEKGGITLRVRPVESSVEFTVADTGVGIGPDNLERIFDRFWQADHGAVQNTSGAGLGLTVSRRLVELIGGRLVVESVAGEGSTFSFRIPAAGVEVSPG
ncbi:MAG TPA: ATP-binding protein [Longimicrobiales bacterium]|nr:ATP-binding protein [Longimicrobiales bacterium]